jgi:DNA-directed RNA polymerase subunit F
MSVSDTKSIDSLLETHRVSLSEAYMLTDPDDDELTVENMCAAHYFKDYISPDEEALEPVSDIYYPIIEDATDSFNLFDGGSYNPVHHNLGGILSLSVYWRDFIKDILPTGSDGILVIFENECNPTFTYQINGPTVAYLGAGDFHDAKYDSLQISSAVNDLRRFAIKDSSYSGIPINEEFCPFYVRVFPSDTMKDHFTSSNAVTFAVSAALIFFFTSCIFLLYDFWVERRQRLVMKTAVHSSAIVSSLFPSTVRDRVFPTQGKKEETTMSRAKTFMNSGNEKDVNADGSNDLLPIADMFPNTTVFFADIA